MDASTVESQWTGPYTRAPRSGSGGDWLSRLGSVRERPTAYFFQASRAHRGASIIAELRRADGTLAEGPAKLAVAELYYAKLFSRWACDPAAEVELLDCISARLGEFYATFWHLLGPDLLEVYRALLEGGALSASMRKGVLVLLYKGGDWTELGNWWPLTLLTTDCKVLAKGGGGVVPRVPLKLDVVYASFASRVFLERAPTKCFFLTRFYLVGFFRHLEVLTHVVPRAEVRAPAYEAVARFLHQCPPSISRAESLDHRAERSRTGTAVL
ncbi:hypothetical protein AAFF_G00380330 [Aldrovandia affinis]|uniref:Uncharacterized protein n=1 Tax=Aldrovandia affinis TaxID=143900 RepID=A0AAD7T7R0_9TELE|nr:hypothetical protein AAFF_G00380330 [Aldrovandia affinis]